MNTSWFAISLIPIFLRLGHRHGFTHIRTSILEYWQGQIGGYKAVGAKSTTEGEEAEDSLSTSQTRLLVDDEAGPAMILSGDQPFANWR